VISYGYAREKKGYMAAAPVPAARMALEKADLSIGDIKVIKTHNPFVVNDLNFAKKMGIDADAFNNYGSSVIYGHPQGSTATRLIIEGIEETVMEGGGYFLWTGCAAGDCGASLILKIG
jgi:acetyl-CoA acetyltransferase